MTNPVRRAFAISLAIHLLIFGLWTLAQAFDLARYFPNLRFLTTAQEWLLPENKKRPLPPEQAKEIILSFVEADPAFAVKEPPPDAKFYSAVSTTAANPTKKLDSDLPHIEGKQEKLLKLTDSQPKSQPLQPTPAQPAEEVKETPAPQPKQKQTVGDLALVKPAEKNEKSSAESDEEKSAAENKPRPRPRTLAEAKAAASRGEKSKTEGGVARMDISSSVAARGTLLGDYDARFVDAVRQCWYDLMSPRTPMKPGKVVVEFRIHHDGRVSEVRVVENTASDAMEALLCETAITKPNPYEKWSPELRRELKSDIREVRFTFYYE